MPTLTASSRFSFSQAPLRAGGLLCRLGREPVEVQSHYTVPFGTRSGVGINIRMRTLITVADFSKNRRPDRILRNLLTRIVNVAIARDESALSSSISWTCDKSFISPHQTVRGLSGRRFSQDETLQGRHSPPQSWNDIFLLIEAAHSIHGHYVYFVQILKFSYFRMLNQL